MSKSKSYNRIIFLTTLSVYLGLVLVGGTAPVLAHSAFTKGFDIKNEIEVKDDLDKKPNDGNPNFKEIDFAGALSDFLMDLRKLQTNNPDKYKQEKDFYDNRTRYVFSDYSLGLEPKKYSAKYTVDTSLETFLDSIDNNCLQNLADFTREKYVEKPFKKISFEVYSSLESDVKLIISFKKDDSQKASLLTDQLNMEFRYRAFKAEQKFVKTIYENTKAAFENNQVFIVTRLPRGSIDSFLK